MTTSTPDTCSGTNQSSATTPTQLDGIFSSPSKEQWLESALAGLGENASLESLVHETLEGLKVDVLYDHAANTTSPGIFRSHSVHSWDNRVAIQSTDDAEHANQRILDALGAGNTSAQLPVTSKTDFSILLNGVMLDVAPVSLRTTDALTSVSANLQRYIETLGLNPATLQISFNADPIGDTLRNGKPSFSLEESLKRMSTFAAQTSALFSAGSTVLVDTTVHHNAGASATQELQAAIATATLYLEHLVSAGLTPLQAARQIVFQMSCDADVLMGVVKLRSLAHLWQHLLLQAYGLSDASGLSEISPLPLVVETSRRYLSRSEHWNNHLRNLAACTAAAMGNATSIIVHPHDQFDGWRASTDSAMGERMARNLPVILEREAGLTKITDPLAGSHAIETLTSDLVELTWQSLSRMNTAAHWWQSVQSGQWQKAIAEVHAKRVARLKAEQQIVVGVNRYTPVSSDEHAAAEVKTSPGQNAGLTLPRVRDSETFESGHTPSTIVHEASSE